MGLLFELKREYSFFSLLEFDCKMYRVRASATSGWGSQAVARFRRKALNSWAAIQDTFFSTKVLSFTINCLVCLINLMGFN